MQLFNPLINFKKTKNTLIVGESNENSLTGFESMYFLGNTGISQQRHLLSCKITLLSVGGTLNSVAALLVYLEVQSFFEAGRCLLWVVPGPLDALQGRVDYDPRVGDDAHSFITLLSFKFHYEYPNTE